MEMCDFFRNFAGERQPYQLIKMKHILRLLLVAIAMLNVQCGVADNGGSENVALQNIMTRTSIRSWTDEPVSPEMTEQLLRAAMAAPTAVNKQPWHFVVLNEREALDALAENTGRGGGMLRKAPLAIVVCGDMNLALDGKAREYWVQDASAATENLLLAANALGLGAVWTGVYPIEERVAATSQALHLPSNLIPLCTVIIGHPAESPTPKDKWDPAKVTYNIPK